MRNAFLSLLLLIISSCEPSEPKIIKGQTMGTTWSLRSVKAAESIRDFIQSHLDQREAVLSHWKRDSAVSRFNDSRSTDWQPVPHELVKVIEAARDISRSSDGALDITLAPLIDLWGFGAAGSAESLPTETQIAEVKARCGWQYLHTRLEPPALKKDQPNLQINVACVVEGFVMDELVELLRQRAISDFVLEVGGEVVACGRAPDGLAWQVGIQTPDAAPGDAMQSMSLVDQCASTSGSYRQRFEKDGRIFSHLIDPRSGRPIEHSLVSVTVIHPSCVLADGYATALMVLGPERGREVADRLGLRVLWITE